jgi:hypothetical protein
MRAETLPVSRDRNIRVFGVTCLAPNSGAAQQGKTENYGFNGSSIRYLAQRVKLAPDAA